MHVPPESSVPTSELASGTGVPPRSVFLKAYHYVNKVKQFRDKDVAKQVRDDLQKLTLESFEVAQLGNLCPEGVEEARALIPSLAEPDRELDINDLEEILQQVSSKKQFST